MPNNRPTDLVNMWLQNEYETYQLVEKWVARVDGDAYKLADKLKDYCEQAAIDLLGSSSMETDLLGWALAMVDWDYLAGMYCETWREEQEHDQQKEQDVKRQEHTQTHSLYFAYHNAGGAIRVYRASGPGNTEIYSRVPFSQYANERDWQKFHWTRSELANTIRRRR